jgi:oxaloacetate decarboxylase alpha subunit
VLNVISGERYKVFTKESKALLRGEYGSCRAGQRRGA